MDEGFDKMSRRGLDELGRAKQQYRVLDRMSPDLGDMVREELVTPEQAAGILGRIWGDDLDPLDGEFGDIPEASEIRRYISGEGELVSQWIGNPDRTRYTGVIEGTGGLTPDEDSLNRAIASQSERGDRDVLFSGGRGRESGMRDFNLPKPMAASVDPLHANDFVVRSYERNLPSEMAEIHDQGGRALARNVGEAEITYSPYQEFEDLELHRDVPEFERPQMDMSPPSGDQGLPGETYDRYRVMQTLPEEVVSARNEADELAALTGEPYRPMMPDLPADAGIPPPNTPNTCLLYTSPSPRD